MTTIAQGFANDMANANGFADLQQLLQSAIATASGVSPAGGTSNYILTFSDGSTLTTTDSITAVAS